MMTMKKNKKVFIFALCVILLLLAYCFAPLSMKGVHQYPTGRDTHVAYENGRFQIMRGGKPTTYSLFDMKKRLNLIYDIEKYYTKGKNVYFTAYFYSSWGKTKNHVEVWTGINPQTGENMRYTNLEDIPRYSILNYETGNVILYKTLEEIPEKDRKIFEKEKFNFYILCYLRGTCFDKNRD